MPNQRHSHVYLTQQRGLEKLALITLIENMLGDLEIHHGFIAEMRDYKRSIGEESTVLVDVSSQDRANPVTLKVPTLTTTNPCFLIQEPATDSWTVKSKD